MKILVTGGARYIGSTITTQLVEAELNWVTQKPTLQAIISDAWEFYQSRKTR